MSKNIRNIGILAHVDAGKTSITEHILYYAGVIRKRGSVDKGTTQTDFLDVERERGISVRSSFTNFEWNGATINLVDTPGHVDFSADVERVLRVLDIAILVVSAAEGVQAHTETLWTAIKEHGIPCIVFINKIDRVGVNIDVLIEEIQKELTDQLFIEYDVSDSGTNNAHIASKIIDGNYSEELIEIIATTDESLLEKYLEDEPITNTSLQNALIKAIHNCQLTPVLFGSAKNEVGVKELLDAIALYSPMAGGDASKPLSALVHSLDYDKTMGKIANVRVFNGSISSRDIVKNSTLGIDEKVTQVRKISSSKFVDIACVEAGDIAAVCGMTEVRAGDILGEATGDIPAPVHLQQPLLTLQVIPADTKDYPALADALLQLSHEDPTLSFEWLKDERELHIKIMGKIQVEVLERIIEQRYGLKAIFEQPTVIYKETPAKAGLGIVRYTMPKPCWAVILFKIEPLEQGSGVHYSSIVSVDKIKQRYQNEVERTISSALKQGIKGWEVTDVKITMIDGEDHEMHSRAGDFAVATPMGLLTGLTETGSTLLEPILSFRIIASDELLGTITSDIIQMRGSFEAPSQENGRFILEGLLPAATSLDYPVRLSSLTSGKGKILTRFHSYQPCSDDLGVIRDYKGISPLDRSKWILKARRALQ